MKLTLGHSPDPDDAFMFHALAHGKIDTEGLEFEHLLQDIETLNRRAERSELDVTALSAHAYAFLTDRYVLLNSGASMGLGYGPILVAREEMTLDECRARRIAVPGERTSAFLALRLRMGEFKYAVVPFDRIIEAVVSGEAEAGLLIHEGQLTYADQGLRMVVDLGAWWSAETVGQASRLSTHAQRTPRPSPASAREDSDSSQLLTRGSTELGEVNSQHATRNSPLGLPLPLGVNAIRRDLPGDVLERADRVLRHSVEWGLTHRDEALASAAAWGRDLDRNRTDRFVSMYVNDLTLDYGDRGREALREFFRRGAEAGLLPAGVEPEFVSQQECRAP